MGASTRNTAAEVPGAESVLRSVVVHSSGAVCARRARVALATHEGTATVRITGLPPTVSEHSLRGRVVSGPAGLRVTDIRLDVGAALRRGDELPGLRLDVEDAEDRQARLRDRRDRLAAEIEEVAAFRAEPLQPKRGDPPRWAPVESILALAGFVDARLATLHERLRAVEDDLARADHDADVLLHRLADASTALSTTRAETTVTAVMTLALDDPRTDPADRDPADHDRDDQNPDDQDPEPDSDRTDRTDRTAGAAGAPGGGATAAAPGDGGADTGAELEVEYHVPGATWVPVYQLRLDGSSGAGTLVLRASVAQRTGEDWTGVLLGLSTADLLRRADLPELRSLRIGRGQGAPPAPAWREPPAGLDELFAGYDAAVRPPAPAPPPYVPLAVPPPAPAPFLVGSAGGGGDLSDTLETYGAFSGPVPAPVAAMAAPGAAPEPTRSPRARRGSDEMRKSALIATPDAAPPGPPPPPARPAPSADLLDYARLTMTGPDAAAGRGELRPAAAGADPVTAEYRRRADAVAWLTRPAHAADVRGSAGSFDYRFETAAPADVEADGTWHTVPVSEVPVRTEVEYVCVPAEDPAVFGTVLVTNTSPHALLAGPADVMVDGDFVLTAPLPTLAPGQRQAVGLGVAESVQVARRTHMRESTAGLRGGTTVLDHTVEVEVASRLPYPVTVEVRERVPVSSDKDVRIEEHRAQPAWTEPGRPLDGPDDDYVRGARVWRVALEPGRTTTLTGGFEIRLPVGKAVVGGNRRN